MTTEDEARAMICEHADELVAAINASAKSCLQALREREALGKIKPNDPTYPRHEVIKWAVSCLYSCSRWEQRPPPQLVDLIAHLFGVEERAFHDLFKSPKGFYQAVRYIARHPQAKNREVARETGVSHPTVGKWRRSDLFLVEVRIERIRISSCRTRPVGFWKAARHVAHEPNAADAEIAEAVKKDLAAVHVVDDTQHQISKIRRWRAEQGFQQEVKFERLLSRLENG